MRPDAHFQVPSLFGTNSPGEDSTALPTVSLLDLLYDGFYMLFMLRNRATPGDAAAFRQSLRDFLTEFEQGARRLAADAEDIHLAKFAFCALVDEVVLTSPSGLRGEWERRPLQLELFGEQLAGERFFDHLEAARHAGAPKVQLLEVFHMCQLMGFQGKYIVEGTEKLSYLTGRVGDEIARYKGRRKGLAPHWAPPDRITHVLRAQLPLWAIASVVALLALLAFLGMRHALRRQTANDLDGYHQIVKLAAPPAYVVLTLP